MRNTQASELILSGSRWHREVVEEPVVERSVVLELEGAQRVAHPFDGVALAVREVIARVDVPGRAGAWMAGVENTVDDGVAKVEVRRRHVDCRAEHPLAVPELAGAHPREQLSIFLHAAVAERAVPARARQCPPALSDIVRGRSEEHTSELQSHHDLVCRLLLEKKKKK